MSDHVAFTRSADLDTGHLLPVPRTREALDVLVANVRAAQAAFDVPLALENIACLFRWPDDELTDGQFLAELVDRTGCALLLDVANLHADACKTGTDPPGLLAGLPAEAVAYLHVAGGVRRDGLYHDTHAHPVRAPVLDLLREACALLDPRGVLLERDDRFAPDAELAAELAAIRRIRDEAVSRRAPAAAPRPGRAGESESESESAGAGEGPRTENPDCAADGPADDAANLEAARAGEAAAQGALVRALVAGGPAPPGFDPDRLRRQSAALRAKRRRATELARPETAAALGPRFPALFGQCARACPPRPDRCARGDADDFVAWLVESGALPGRPSPWRLRRRARDAHAG